MNYKRIRGVIVPMLTSFTGDGSLDIPAAHRLIDYLIANGVSGLFPLGTTGEGPLLSMAERQEFAQAVVDHVAGRIPVIVHTGAVNTRATQQLTQHARDIGADAAAIVPPYFYPLSQDALINHFYQVARQTPDFPIYLYNNPAVASNAIPHEVVTHLAQACSNIIGLKDSGGSLAVLFASRHLNNGQFNTALGPDGLILAGLAMGLDACVSGNANVVPRLVVNLYNAATTGDLQTARDLQEKLNRVRVILKDGADLSLFKGILARRGLPVGSVRLPLTQAAEGVIDACWQQLTAEALDTQTRLPTTAMQ